MKISKPSCPTPGSPPSQSRTEKGNSWPVFFTTRPPPQRSAPSLQFFPNDCKDGALRWGGDLVVKNTGQEFPFSALDCDGGEPGGGHDGVEIFIPDELTTPPGYAVTCPQRRGESPPFCVLTGGNRQFHPTH